MAAETAAPVIACAAGKGPLDELDFQFAGVVRSNSVRTMDDGVGPTTDEYFTFDSAMVEPLHAHQKYTRVCSLLTSSFF